MKKGLSEGKIKRIKKETPSSVSLYLDRSLLSGPYASGQFVDLHFDIDGNSVSRSYSISSAENEEDFRLTIKGIADGWISKIINEQLKEGDTISLEGPSGRFVLNQNKDEKTKVFIGAGSGITPIWSMIQTLLTSSTKMPIILFYGNRTSEEAIFLDEIDQVSKDPSNNLEVHHFLTKPNTWLGLFSKEQIKYTSGRIQCLDVIQAVYDNGLTLKDTEFYICGPTGLNTEMKTELMSSGAPEESIKIEHFISKVSASRQNNEDGQKAQLEIRLKGEQINIECDYGTPVLEALIDEGYDPPHSCTAGACCTCMAQLEEGEVQMERDDALSKDEISKGFILTCQATPDSQNIKINFDID